MSKYFQNSGRYGDAEGSEKQAFLPKDPRRSKFRMWKLEIRTSVKCKFCLPTLLPFKDTTCPNKVGAVI